MPRRARIIVRFDDGHTEEFNPNRPRFLLDMEKRFGVQAPERHEHVAWLAHHALAADKPFEAWIDSVEELDSVAVDDDDDEKSEEGKDLS